MSGPKDGRAAIENTAGGFHTYGLRWVDARTLRFYYDGKFMFTVHPGSAVAPRPIDAAPVRYWIVT